MRKLLNTIIISAALSAALPATTAMAAVSADNRAWINNALSSSRPEKSGNGVMSSSGDQINPSDVLPPASEEEQQMIDDAKGSYGDDNSLLGASEGGAKYLASGGADTKSGQAFAIVNQEIGFETRIEHKIYQHEVLYENDLTGAIDSNLIGYAWWDMDGTLGSESGGGTDRIWTTPIPSGKKRSIISLFAAPIKFGNCERAQVKITGGTDWVPGCSEPGANCERIISSPMSSALFQNWVSTNIAWEWVDHYVYEPSRASIVGSGGWTSPYNGYIEFPRTTFRDTTSIQAIKDRMGVRKIEASGLCNHPNPSNDPYYIQSLPNCDDPDLRPGQECGKVERQQVSYEENPFSAELMSSQLNGMMEDCQIIEEDVTEVIRSSELETKFCGRSQPASFPGCRITHDMSVIKSKIRTPGGTNAWEIVYTVNDQWNGTQRCKSLLTNVAKYDQMCEFDVQYVEPSCKTIDGTEVCVGDELYDQLSDAPGGWGNRLTSEITITDVNCETQSGSVTYEGQTVNLEPYNYCAAYEQDPAYEFIQSECITETSTDMGSWCSEWQDQYQYEEITEREVTETRTKLVCGNQEIYCADGSCLDQQDKAASDGFAKAAAMLSAVQGIASHTECDDPTRAETCRVFSGEANTCRKGKGGFDSLWNCCDLSSGGDSLDEESYVEAILGDGASQVFIGANATMFFDGAEMLLKFFVPCNDEEISLATSKEIDAEIYLGSYCGEKISLALGKICIRTDRAYCAWPTTLGRVIMEQAKPMVGGGFGDKRNPDCRGLTIEQLANLDWSRLDLSDWADKLIDTGNLPSSDFSEIGSDPGAWTPENNPGGVGWSSQ